jgi:Putative peptidoglycan binding domain
MSRFDAKLRACRKRLSALGVAVLAVASCLMLLPAFTQSASARALRPARGSRSHHSRRMSRRTSSSPQSSSFTSSKKSTSKKKSRTRKPKGQMAPTPERIQEIQSALARGGYYTNEPNGKMDAGTQDALRHFQEANGINPTGKIDAITLEKLGLGPDTAGVSAPKQTPPPAQTPAPASPHN